MSNPWAKIRRLFYKFFDEVFEYFVQQVKLLYKTIAAGALPFKNLWNKLRRRHFIAFVTVILGVVTYHNGGLAGIALWLVSAKTGIQLFIDSLAPLETFLLLAGTLIFYLTVIRGPLLRLGCNWKYELILLFLLEGCFFTGVLYKMSTI